MRHATRSRVPVGHTSRLLRAASIKQMQKWRRRLARCVCAQEAVPERTPRNSRDLQARIVYLTMKRVQAVDCDLTELMRFDFGAAIRRGLDLVFQVGAEAFHLSRTRIEQQGADGRASNIETYDEGTVDILL